MKRALLVAFFVLMLCSLLLLINAGTIKATEPGYDYIIEAYTVSDVTVDGNWAAGEWEDAWIEYLDPYDARFAYKMETDQATYYLMSWLVEFPDNTTDAGDIWQICIDGSADGGAAPDDNDHKIEIEGHTTLKVYQGTGTGWAEQTTTAVTWADSLTTTSSWSPYDATHYVLEVQVDKGVLNPSWGGNPPPHGLRVAMYDASNVSQGWIAWPPTDPDVPESWGLIYTYQETVPESLSFGVVVLLSSVAVAVSFYFLRKRPNRTLQLS